MDSYNTDKINYGITDNEKWVVDYIAKNISSSHFFLPPEFCRNNFERIKKEHGILWEATQKLPGKKITLPHNKKTKYFLDETEMREHDVLLRTNEDIIEWLKINTSTPKKLINANYTKDNFKLFKSTFPNIWKQIKNKTITYKTTGDAIKTFSFADKDYKPLVYNNVVVSSSSVWNFKNVQILISDTTPDSSMRDIISVCAKNRLSGLQLMQIAKKAFPEEFKILQKIRQKCSNDREALYCYLHEIEPIVCNNKKLTFRTIGEGYSYQKLALYYNENKDQDFRTIVSNLNKLDFCFVTTFTRLFLPHVHDYILQECNSRSIPESYYLFMQEKDTPDTCLHCNSPCEFLTLNTGYRDFCSEGCRSIYYGIKHRKYRDPQEWNQYKMLVDYYTMLSYRKYRHIINPQNFRRGMKEYHYQIDHIIPKIYGFENCIDPRKISHFKNLQMLLSRVNNSKGRKIYDESFIDIIVNLTDNDIEYLKKHD
jgi:hypothetical protein